MATQALEYKLHRLATIFPELSSDEFKDMKASIQKIGLLEPITLWRKQIIDGRHRYLACREINYNLTEHDFYNLSYDANPGEYVLAKNNTRRHMDESQRAMAASEVLQIMPMTVEEVSEVMNVSDRSVKKATYVQKEAVPEIKEAVKQGNVSLDDAERVIRAAEKEVNEALDNAKVLADAGIISREKLQEASDAMEKQKAVEQKEALKKVQTGQAKTLQSAAKKVEREQISQSGVALPEGQYYTIVVDPPWPIAESMDRGGGKETGPDYPIMTVEDIIKIDIPSKLATNSWVFLWTTQSFLRSAFDVLEAWGLRHRRTMVWMKGTEDKVHGNQNPDQPKSNVEFVLIGSVGQPIWTDLKAFSLGFIAPTKGDSVKPEAFYELLRRVTPAPRLDMYNRRSIQGFKGWGNQAAS